MIQYEYPFDIIVVWFQFFFSIIQDFPNIQTVLCHLQCSILLTIVLVWDLKQGSDACAHISLHTHIKSYKSNYN